VAVSPKQHRFIEVYLLDRNATQAAIRVGHSARSAREMAHRLLNYDYITRATALRSAHQAAKLKVTREKVIKALVASFEVAKSQATPEP